MKNFILPILLLCVLFVKSQDILPTENGIIRFTEIVEVENKSKALIYSNALQWINSNFERPQNVIRISDNINGVISGEAILQAKIKIMVTFTITAKDNKYRIVVDNIKELYQPLSGPGTYVNIDNGYQNYLKRLEEGKKVGKVPEFFYSYKETIETKIINSLKAYILKNDDF